MDSVLIPIILAGGKGERFWPLSRRQRPKQFLSLDGSGTSLLQATAARLLAVAGGWERLWVITAAHLASGVQTQLPELPAENLLVEPEGRDTAAAVAWATLEASRRYGEAAIVGFFPADHWIVDTASFAHTLQAAALVAETEGAIVTLGIQPTYAATGYGYIEQGAAIGEFAGMMAYRVNRFTEKPNLETATQFLNSGRFGWNGGIFVFQTAVALQELHHYAPEILDPLRREGVGIYPTLPKISIDYALMEKTQRACVLPVSFDWDDLGDWNAIERLLRQEPANQNAPNVALANSITADSQGCIFYASDPEELVVAIGLENLVVVRDGKATLIVHKDRTQEIKQILKRLQADPSYQDFL